MNSVDTGVLEKSICFSFTPSKLAKELYFYPTWCGHYFCTNNYYIKRSSFPSLLIAYVRNGIFHFEYRDMVFDAEQGDVILLDCVEPHYYHARDGLEFVYMHFDGSNSHEICQYILSQHGPLIHHKNNLLIGNLLYDMVDFHQNNGLETMFQSSMRIYQIFEHLLIPQKNALIESVSRYIHSNIRKDISLEALANEVGLSTYYFSHCFKEQTGFSPMEFVINMRLNRAKILLVRTSKPITEIACEVGYSSARSLTNIFTKKEGMSPGQYRRTYQNQSNS